MIRRAPSPNFGSRLEGASIDYVVLHYTDMESAEAALKRMCDPGGQVSAHYMIDEDGSILQLVDESKRAWHAGHSFWRGVRDMNSASIGIELVNPGHNCGYRPFPDAQIKALCELLADIFARHSLPPSALLAHSDIAPRRKTDPGELFPWETLAQLGFGLWPRPEPEDYGPELPDEVSGLLSLVGYDCPGEAEDEAGFIAARSAFQRHYCPDKLEAEMDNVQLAKLRALARIAA